MLVAAGVRWPGPFSIVPAYGPVKKITRYRVLRDELCGILLVCPTCDSGFTIMSSSVGVPRRYIPCSLRNRPVKSPTAKNKHADACVVVRIKCVCLSPIFIMPPERGGISPSVCILVWRTLQQPSCSLCFIYEHRYALRGASRFGFAGGA